MLKGLGGAFGDRHAITHVERRRANLKQIQELLRGRKTGGEAIRISAITLGLIGRALFAETRDNVR
jgi:hypothetical protein